VLAKTEVFHNSRKTERQRQLVTDKQDIDTSAALYATHQLK
jgi:hypothetical protein